MVKRNGTVLKIKNPSQLVAWILKNKKSKEALMIVSGVLFLLLIMTCVILFLILYGYDSKKGFYKTPTETRLEYKKK